MPDEKIILVVEDDLNLLELYRVLFEANNYKVLSAPTGEKAVEIYSKTDNIGVVILDMVLPGISGEDVLNEIQQKNINQNVIMCTGYQLENTFTGNVKLLSKPFLTPALLELVKECFQ